MFVNLCFIFPGVLSTGMTGRAIGSLPAICAIVSRMSLFLVLFSYELLGAVSAEAAPAATATDLPALSVPGPPPTTAIDSSVVAGPEGDISEDENLLILELRLGKLTLSESILGNQIPSGICLNFSELVVALEFPINVFPEQFRAQGWFLSESRTFQLTSNGVVISGEDAAFDPELISVQQKDLCVDLALLKAWFPIELQYDQSNALVEVVPGELLPVQQRLERERRRKLLGPQADSESGFDRVNAEYRLWDWPVVDVTTGAQVARTARGDQAALSTRHNVLATGDLLRLNGEVFVAGDDLDPLSTVRARLGRKDPHGDLLGPLSATSFSLGDVASPQTALVSRSVTGRGAEVSSFPLGRSQEFDRTTLRGALPLGWEVELYRNKVLLEFQLSRDDGRYEFLDVPLLFGRNSFRLVFYGPEGQRREEKEELFIDPGFVRPGDSYYRLAINQQNRDLINLSKNTLNQPEENELRVAAQVETGITETWSTGGGVYSLPIDGTRLNYITGFVRNAFPSVSTRLELAANDNDGIAAEVSAQGSFGTINYLLRHDHFQGFRSERSTDGTSELSSRTMVRGDSVLSIADGFALPFTMQADLNRHEDDRKELSLSNRISASHRSLLITNNLEADIEFGGGNEKSKRAAGSLLVNYRIAPAVIRGDFGYALHPDAALNSLA